MFIKRFIVLFLLVCATNVVHANNVIEKLYGQLTEKPSAKVANLLIQKLLERGQADSLVDFKRDDDRRIMLIVPIYMSYYFFDKGDYETSLKMNEQALLNADPEQDAAIIADNYFQMSAAYTCLSKYREAISVNLKAIALAEEKGLVSSLGTAYYNVGSSYLSLKNYSAAWRFTQKAILQEMQRDNQLELSSCYGLAAEILMKQKKFDEALAYVVKAIAISKKEGCEENVAAHQLQAADIYIAQAKFNEARRESEQALEYFGKAEPRLETIINFKQYGLILARLNETAKAKRYLRKAEELCLQMNNRHQLVSIYETLSEIERKTNPARAMLYLDLRDLLKDSIFSEETNRLVADAEVKYETSQKELKIQEQQNEMKTRQMWFTVTISAALVAILLIIVYASITNSRKNKRHAAQLKVERDAAEKARDEAERANALKGVFIDNVVHELRTPINAIQGFSQLLDPSFGSSPEEVAEYLGIINENCDNLITLVQDTIDVSEMESASYPVHPAEVQIEAICREAAGKEQHRLQEKNVKIHVRETGGFTVTTDKALLTRLLQNLISNACKYTTSGSITIEFHKGRWSERQGFRLDEMIQRARDLEKDSGPAKPWNLAEDNQTEIPTTPIWAEEQPPVPQVPETQEPPVPQVPESQEPPVLGHTMAEPQQPPTTAEPQSFSLTVTDTGCGIPPENAEKIFNRFEKLGSYIPGNGMGLTIVRLIATLLHGQAYLDTNYQAKGSRFVAELQNLKTEI